MKRCLGCMNEISDDEAVCPYCGYIPGTFPEEKCYLPLGRILNQRYMVGRVLGSGGFGITYIGWDFQLDHRVAIKEYYPRELVSGKTRSTSVSIVPLKNTAEQYQKSVEKFIEEAQNLSKFEGEEDIVGILNFFQENNTGYIVMEYLEGESLKKKLKNQEIFSYEEAEKIILEVLTALEKLHKVNIIHRDISPDNIFVDKDGKICLIDFGAARNYVSQCTKTVILKPSYAPFEQYYSDGKQGPWTDVYSVGATFYRLITGKLPVDSRTRLSKKATLQSPSELGVNITPEQESVIMKSLNLKCEERFQSASEFKEALLLSDEQDSDEKKVNFLPKILFGGICICLGLYLYIGRGSLKIIDNLLPNLATTPTITPTPTMTPTPTPILYSYTLTSNDFTPGRVVTAADDWEGWEDFSEGEIVEADSSSGAVTFGVTNLNEGDELFCSIIYEGDGRPYRFLRKALYNEENDVIKTIAYSNSKDWSSDWPTELQVKISNGTKKIRLTIGAISDPDFSVDDMLDAIDAGEIIVEVKSTSDDIELEKLKH